MTACCVADEIDARRVDDDVMNDVVAQLDGRCNRRAVDFASSEEAARQCVGQGIRGVAGEMETGTVLLHFAPLRPPHRSGFWAGHPCRIRCSPEGEEGVVLEGRLHSWYDDAVD